MKTLPLAIITVAIVLASCSSSKYAASSDYDDVYYYPNEYEKNYERGEEIGKLIKTGWVRCKEECPKSGHCIEFGVSGAAYCFSY